ncbi:fasciclin domain-containing protein [Niabella beijingensis]|uniref:fasciclin domain-containing protein n=1 Tax=Niabella beijingensis TaxID=2872700 RepID=UPI001CC12483|nr:fasciclin domain-containing protein [Niabella beijingensis]MBZ4188308.1 fasciclin domain-containing protein [Niabella beijingensis]
MRKIYLLPLFLVLFMTGLFYSCRQKPDGYYDFSNKENVFEGTMYEYLKSKNGIYDSLLKTMERVPWLKDSLQKENGAFTLFAPVNNNFRLALQNLNIVRQGTGKPLLDLNTVDALQLDTLMDWYVVKGNYTTDSMLYVDGLYMRSAKNNDSLHAQRVIDGAQGVKDGGPTSVYYSYTNRSQFVSNWVRALTQVVNIKTKNGTVHVLSFANEFGFNQFTNRMNK